MTQVTIRPFKETDFACLSFLWLDSWNSTGIKTVHTETLTSLRRRLRQVMDRGSWTIHIATTTRGVVGFIALKDNVLEQLFVARAMQGKGIGKRLLDFVKSERPQGFSLITHGKNWRACRFYEREGLRRGKPTLGRRPGYRIIRFDCSPNTRH